MGMCGLISSITRRNTLTGSSFFEESLYYVPRLRIVEVLRRYTKYLREDGVVIVRLYDRHKYRAIHQLLKSNFHIIEEFIAEDSDAVILVFK